MFIVIILSVKKKYKHIARKEIKTILGYYYQSVSSGIGNKLMAIANQLILSEIKNRYPYCISNYVTLSYRMD